MTRTIVERYLRLSPLRRSGKLGPFLGAAGMVLLVLALSVPLGAIGGARAAGSAFPAAGASATAFWYDPATNTNGNVWVSRGGSPSSPETWLDYEVWTCDQMGNCQDEIGGYGQIPNSALTGDMASGLSLSIDTNQIPDFAVYAGTGGPITVAWQPTKAFKSSFSGSQHYSMASPKCINVSGGSSTTISSTAEGSLPDLPIPSGSFSTMQTFHGSSISVGPCGP